VDAREEDLAVVVAVWVGDEGGEEADGPAADGIAGDLQGRPRHRADLGFAVYQEYDGQVVGDRQSSEADHRRQHPEEADRTSDTAH
jgi:hypothetical protein